MLAQSSKNRARRRPGADPGPSTLAFRRDPAGPEPRPHNSAAWLVNGHPAEVRAWSPEEWDRDPDTPPDAKLLPSGIRVAFRIP